jgi:hypothetical protein
MPVTMRHSRKWLRSTGVSPVMYVRAPIPMLVLEQCTYAVFPIISYSLLHSFVCRPTERSAR